MKKLTLALVAAAGVWAGPLAAQAPPADNAALRQQIERRFEVLVLTDRIVLRPRSAAGSVRLIELGETRIAIDGVPATGAEVKEKLGSDADAVLRLSYLDTAQQRARLNAIFPKGVCDWSKRGVQQVRSVPWASFGPSRENLVFGTAMAHLGMGLTILGIVATLSFTS